MTPLTRRELLAGAGAGAAALVLEQNALRAQPPSTRPFVFSHTTIVTVDAVQNDVALTVDGDKIAAIGPTDQVLGSLEVGKKADLIVVDTQGAHLVPAGRIESAWIHNGQPSDIESIMVDGQFVMRNRKVLTMERGRHHRRSRQGRLADLDRGAGGRSDCRAGPSAPVITRLVRSPSE